MKMATRVRRSAIENDARSLCRTLVHSLQSRIDKIGKTHVHISPCDHWPEGIITEYHGWMNLLLRLRACNLHPALVEHGIYYHVDNPEEFAGCLRVKQEILRNLPPETFRRMLGAAAGDSL